jgi:hypothetical protein
MELSTILLFGALMCGVYVLSAVLKARRAGSDKYQHILADFQQRVESMLQEGETVEGLCGYKPCAAVTDRRLLVDGRSGIESVAFQQIKKIKGMDAAANKTTDPNRMLVLEIRAEKKYVLGNHTDGFVEFVNALCRHRPLG